MVRSGISVQKSLKNVTFILKLGKSGKIEIFFLNLKIVLQIIYREFDRGINGEFRNDFVGRSRDLLKILVLLKRIWKIDL